MTNPVPKISEENIIPFEYPVLEQILLYKPESTPTIDFFDTLTSRKSSRSFTQISTQDLGALLWYCAHVKGIYKQENGYILSHRASPSAGARHPIDLLISSTHLGEKQLHFYNPFDHTLNKLLLDQKILGNLQLHLTNILDIKNATIIWFVAHSNRTEAKYENAQSLVWRDAGAIINCLQLVATALGFSSCAAGTLGEPFIADLFKERGSVVGVGCMLVG